MSAALESFGPCKTCGNPLLMVKVRELNGQLIAACLKCDVVGSNAEQSSSEEHEAELIRRMTAAMREADRTFERVGGSTRHHVRDCLVPILSRHGLELRLVVSATDQCESGRKGRAEAQDG